jgi:protoheme IX farnesyltransferase
MKSVLAKIRLYWPLIKSLQTGLLVATGLTGYMSACCPIFHLPTMAGLLVSLLASISGSTILNMWWDRDIDAKMGRTQKRPLASEAIDATEALRVGLLLSVVGVGLAASIDALFGLLIFAGLYFDVVIYTMWLKRRTCWSIVWGGVAGGMPILAGRALAVGGIDWVGVMLALGILFWIPTHILTFSIRYRADYQAAGVPTFPSTYGVSATNAIIILSSLLAALAMGLAGWGVGMAWGFLRLLGVLSLGLLIPAVVIAFRPSPRVNLVLFKYASVYMMLAMILIAIQVF